MTQTPREEPGRQRLLVASDKFRGTASATEIGEAVLRAGERAGWGSTNLPMSDGGEGLVDILDATRHEQFVHGPNGASVRATWALLDERALDGRLVAIVEMARASGLVLAGGAAHNDPEAASSAGTGELVLAAARAGATRIVVGCGGSATTDGGLGALDVLAQRHELEGVDLVAATDVTTRFLDAARVFGPQKGADEAMVGRLSARLSSLATRYESTYGVDVTVLDGSGAAGGLAGAIAALGGRIVSGFELSAGLVGLDRALVDADLVVTGEGKLDRTSLSGKVVGGVLARALPGTPVLVVVGDSDPDTEALLPKGASLVDLTARYGRRRALREPLALVEEVTYEHLSSLAGAAAASTTTRT